jgi:hypothetical protein
MAAVFASLAIATDAGGFGDQEGADKLLQATCGIGYALSGGVCALAPAYDGGAGTEGATGCAADYRVEVAGGISTCVACPVGRERDTATTWAANAPCGHKVGYYGGTARSDAAGCADAYYEATESTCVACSTIANCENDKLGQGTVACNTRADDLPFADPFVEDSASGCSYSDSQFAGAAIPAAAFVSMTLMSSLESPANTMANASSNASSSAPTSAAARMKALQAELGKASAKQRFVEVERLAAELKKPKKATEQDVHIAAVINNATSQIAALKARAAQALMEDEFEKLATIAQNLQQLKTNFPKAAWKRKRRVVADIKIHTGKITAKRPLLGPVLWAQDGEWNGTCAKGFKMTTPDDYGTALLCIRNITKVQPGTGTAAHGLCRGSCERWRHRTTITHCTSPRNVLFQMELGLPWVLGTRRRPNLPAGFQIECCRHCLVLYHTCGIGSGQRAHASILPALPR